MSQPNLELEDDDGEIASHHVSEDGVHWRPFNSVTDRGLVLHRRIVFAPTAPETSQ